MLFIFLTQKHDRACSERGDPGTAEIYFWCVSEPSAHSCQTLPLHHSKLKTTSLIDQGPRVYTNTSELRQRTLMTESKKDERENMTNDAVTVITCTNHRQLRLFSYTVVKNEDFKRIIFFLNTQMISSKLKSPPFIFWWLSNSERLVRWCFPVFLKGSVSSSQWSDGDL